jgi:hypothetical protein
MKAAGVLAQLVQRADRLGDGTVELRPVLRRHRRLRRAQPEAKGQEPLLGAVVQVPLHPPAGLVGGGDDPRAGGGEFGVQLGVVEGDGELGGDELDRVEPFGGERAAQEPVFQHQHRPQRAAAKHGQGQQRAAAGAGEVRVAGEPVIAGGIAHH